MFFQHLIGKTPIFESLIRSARIIAASDANVVLVGETGVGKDAIAQAIMKSSSRAQSSFVVVNCSALPETLLESELFGHRKGAFTGAEETRVGRLDAADGGTLFLDEVDALTPGAQAKLLRFLENGEIQPIGEVKTRSVDVRIIAASNADFQERIADGRFRRDLYYRLFVVPLDIPPLRNRRDDIPLFLEHFCQAFSAANQTPPPILNPRMVQRLMRHAWPGNIRELRNLCQRLCILCPGRLVEESHVPPEVFGRPGVRVASVTDPMLLPQEGIDLDELERSLIIQALKREQGNRSGAARLLNITRDALVYRLKKHDIRD